jgi:hypothetical protein
MWASKPRPAKEELLDSDRLSQLLADVNFTGILKEAAQTPETLFAEDGGKGMAALSEELKISFTKNDGVRELLHRLAEGLLGDHANPLVKKIQSTPFSVIEGKYLISGASLPSVRKTLPLLEELIRRWNELNPARAIDIAWILKKETWGRCIEAWGGIEKLRVLIQSDGEKFCLSTGGLPAFLEAYREGGYTVTQDWGLELFLLSLTEGLPEERAEPLRAQIRTAGFKVKEMTYLKPDTASVRGARRLYQVLLAIAEVWNTTLPEAAAARVDTMKLYEPSETTRFLNNLLR